MINYDSLAEMRGRTTFEAVRDYQTDITTINELPDIDVSMARVFDLEGWSGAVKT